MVGGSLIANEAAASIGYIVKEINTLGDMNIQIATATKEQGVVSEEMNRNVHEIS